jgi:hypothetical protein
VASIDSGTVGRRATHVGAIDDSGAIVYEELSRAKELAAGDALSDLQEALSIFKTQSENQ